MDLHLERLNHSFSKKPLLVGGKAMEYYKLRKAGEDTDLIVPKSDLVDLIKIYPNRVKDLWGDLGVCPLDFEIWKTICFLDYDYLSEDAIEETDFLVISLEKLLIMKALAMKKEKYLKDTYLVVDEILKRANEKFDEITAQNKSILEDISGIKYIEKSGPQ